MLGDNGAIPFDHSFLDRLVPQLKGMADFASRHALRDAAGPATTALSAALASPVAKAVAELSAASTASTRATLASALNAGSPTPQQSIAAQMQSSRSALLEQIAGPTLEPSAITSLLAGTGNMIGSMRTWREGFLASASWAATSSAAKPAIAEIMQRLADLRVLPRQQGFAHRARRLWDRALEAARETSRRTIEALTQKRTDVDAEFRRPARQRGPDGRNKRRSLLVLRFTEAHYVIRELLIRAPGFGGLPRRTPSYPSGELPCSMTTVTRPKGRATARPTTPVAAA